MDVVFMSVISTPCNKSGTRRLILPGVQTVILESVSSRIHGAESCRIM